METKGGGNSRLGAVSEITLAILCILLTNSNTVLFIRYLTTLNLSLRDAGHVAPRSVYSTKKWKTAIPWALSQVEAQVRPRVAEMRTMYSEED